MHKTANPPLHSVMAVIKKEQDKAALAKPVTTSGVNKYQMKYKPGIPMSTEGNNAGSEITRVLLLHTSNKEIKAKFAAVMEKLCTLEEASPSQNLPLPNNSVPELILSDHMFICPWCDSSMYGST